MRTSLRCCQAADTMLAGLKAQIKDLPAQDYENCRGFLRSLVYAISKSDLQ